MQNYFNYFTEIEEHFSRRRGSLLLLSTLDWALIESWREAGVPLAAALRGIDAAFDKYEARRSKSPGRQSRKINGLAWCAQAVMAAVEEMQEAVVGTAPSKETVASGFERERIAGFLTECAAQYTAAARAHNDALAGFAKRLDELAFDVRDRAPKLEELERNLAVLEEKLFATLLTTMAEADLLALREQAARELAPYRGRMQTVQIRQVEQQFLHKRLLERYGLPRISLFYMPQS
jgi:hypothetical protein